MGGKEKKLLNLPKKTEFRKRIPKQSFYEETKADTKTKQLFVDHIESIEWSYKLSVETTNLETVETIREIQIFTIKQRTNEIPQKLLEKIDSKIPYPILYILISNQTDTARYKLKMANKKVNLSKNNSTILSYHETKWMTKEEIAKIQIINGQTIRDTYESILKKLVEIKIEATETIEDTLKKDVQRQTLEKEIETLRKKMQREKQTNRKVDLNIQLQNKERLLKELRL
jgi:hypothetical protein